MIRKIKNLFWKILNTFNLGGPIQLMLNGSLIEDGWFKSFNIKQSVDKYGNPIPWYTYSSIKFIGPRLKDNFKIFEYGCGNSTLWFSKRVRLVKSVEHNKEWLESLSKELPSNVEIILCELSEDGNYAKEVLQDNNFYEVIIIDGRDRNSCVKYAVKKLTDDGVIIFDNTQIKEYVSSINYLTMNGFKRIDFIGNLPIVVHNNTTTIFYRDGNCFGI